MDFWEDLLDYIKDGRVVPVIGSELLQVKAGGQDVLLYHYLATQLAAEVGVDTTQLRPNFSLNDVVCRYLRANPQPAPLYRKLRVILEKNPVSVPESLRKLARIRPLKLFVSTTFDSMLEQALNAERYGGAPRTITRAYSPSQVRDEADLPADYHDMQQTVVFRLFGKLSGIPDYVVTEEDTLEFISNLQSRERRPNRLFDELKANHLLFIGNSFSDWLARFFIRLTRGERFLAGANFMMQYLADEKVRTDSNFILFLESFGRNQAELYTESGPVEFVDQLYERWCEREGETVVRTPRASDEEPVMPPIAPKADDEEAADVFLSYSRDDSEAAMRIRQILNDAGIKVWLDRSRIKHGEEWSYKIQRSIRQCSLFFPIVSHSTQRRREGIFYEEWKCAEERARRMKADEIFIVPIPIDNSPVPDRLGSKHYEVFPNGELKPQFVAYVKDVLDKILKRDERLENAH